MNRVLKRKAREENSFPAGRKTVNGSGFVLIQEFSEFSFSFYSLCCVGLTVCLFSQCERHIFGVIKRSTIWFDFIFMFPHPPHSFAHFLSSLLLVKANLFTHYRSDYYLFEMKLCLMKCSLSLILLLLIHTEASISPKADFIMSNAEFNVVSTSKLLPILGFTSTRSSEERQPLR